MKCTNHSSRTLIPKATKFGTRFSCPVGGCTVVYWGGSDTTPADETTRQARTAAHEAFDQLWKSGLLKRSEAYRKLAAYLSKTYEYGGKIHIGHFDQETCLRTIEFSKLVQES